LECSRYGPPRNVLHEERQRLLRRPHHLAFITSVIRGKRKARSRARCDTNEPVRCVHTVPFSEIMGCRSCNYTVHHMFLSNIVRFGGCEGMQCRMVQVAAARVAILARPGSPHCVSESHLRLQNSVYSYLNIGSFRTDLHCRTTACFGFPFGFRPAASPSRRSSAQCRDRICIQDILVPHVVPAFPM
jgi:hypothetical protein